MTFSTRFRETPSTGPVRAHKRIQGGGLSERRPSMERIRRSRPGWRALVAVVLLASATRAADPEVPQKGKWVSLFNGKDLDGWLVKIKGHELGDNYLDTFRVEGGVLKVSYDKYKQFDGKFGHLFYKDK